MGWVRRSRVVLVLGFVSFLVFAATASRGPVSMDVESAELSSWHLATTGSPYIDDARLPQFLEDSPIRSIWVQEAHGHRVVIRSPGVVAAALPAYWVVQPDQMTVVPGGLTAALLSALTLVLMFLALRTRLSERLALGSTLVMGFATPFWAVSANGMWPHTVTIFGLAGMAWAASVSRWWAAGVFGAVAMWGRLHAGIIVALFGILVGLRRRQPGITVRIGVVSLAGMVLLGWWTHWMYGSWNPRASYGASDLTDNSTMFSLTNQLGVWVSPGRGLLVWTPLVLVLAPAVAREWRNLPDWSRALATGTLVYALVQGSMQTFTGGDGFYAYRYGLEIVAAWTPAFAFSLHRAGPLARRLVLPVVALQVIAVTPGALLERPYLDQGRAWTENDFADLLRSGGPSAFVVAALLVLGLWAILHRLAGPGRPDGASEPPRASVMQAAER